MFWNRRRTLGVFEASSQVSIVTVEPSPTSTSSPSMSSSSDRGELATPLTTFCSTASAEPSDSASRTAASANFSLRPLVRARSTMYSAASLVALRASVSSVSPPPRLTGVAAPSAVDSAM
jgi:hypothetical protein